jgi:polypeptide N-acetylgalactosaminyltransferase
MKQQLDDYVASHLPKVRVLRVPLPRKGLMAARMLGARNATGEVLVFLDSNLETNTNWLPPLLGKLRWVKETLSRNRSSFFQRIDIERSNDAAGG